MAWALLGLFIFISYTLEAITGFGSIVIGLSLGALLFPVAEIMPLLVTLNIFMSGFLVIKNRQHILWRLLLTRIAPLMLAGTVIGAGLRPYINNQLLVSLFAVLIITFGLRELYKIYRQFVEPPRASGLRQLLIAGAGLTHGLFASGGPLLVFALAGCEYNRHQMRATLLVVWFSLNSLLTLHFLFNGALAAQGLRLLAYAPILVVGIIVGEYLHRRVSELLFRKLIYLLLSVTGALLLARNLFA